MIVTSWTDGDEQDDREIEEIAAEQALNRRLLLRGAVGGFALMAGGLFLPIGDDEAVARGALGGDKGGRRGNDNKGRHKKRNHGDKKGNKNDAPRGGGPLFRSTALKVVNSSANPLQAEFFYRIKTGLDDYGSPIANGTQTISPGNSFRYDPDRYRVGVLIKRVLGPEDIYADVRNVSLFYPRGGVSKGRNLNPAGGTFGVDLISEANFFEGEEQQGENVVLQRLVDDSAGAKRIEWQLVIR